MRLLRHEVKQHFRLNRKLMTFNIFPDILEKGICGDAPPFKREVKLLFGHKGLGAIRTPRLLDAFKKSRMPQSGEWCCDEQRMEAGLDQASGALRVRLRD